MSKKMFDEFEKVSSKQWKQKIQVDLKGADYNETLIWKSLEGLDVKPFYTIEDIVENKPFKLNRKSSWSICQKIYVFDIEKSNKKALIQLSAGVESLHFVIPNETTEIKELLKDIPKSVTLFFSLEFLSKDFIISLHNVTSERSVYINLDIISNLAISGNWFFSLQQDHKILDEILLKNITNQTVLSVDLGLYQNAGANSVQQLAYAIAHTNEYLNHFGEKLKNVKTPILFNTTIGSNYFFEIAKLRALRLLFNTLALEYDIYPNCHIYATPTKRNKTLYDYNTNMLRTTSECMSAILGGADTVCNLPYDAIYHKDNDFGERISKNQLLILKNESYFDATNNPADGAYYIEELTEELAKRALELFKNIEANGGFLKQLKEGIIQKKIKESALKEQELFDAGKLVLIGTNKYPNPKDKMKNDLELYPFLKQRSGKTLLEPIVPKRLSENIEQERLKTE